MILILVLIDQSSTDEPLPLPEPGVHAQKADVMDLIDVLAYLRPYVNVSDYPEAKPALLHLLAQHRQAIPLPGEPLGVTNKVTHHIELQPGAQPSYVPSYRLPHSQRQVVQQKVDELFQGVIQESYSPWNSPLFFIEVHKVSALTIPGRYSLQFLS